jgi:hypothetical protein
VNYATYERRGHLSVGEVLGETLVPLESLPELGWVHPKTCWSMRRDGLSIDAYK